MSNKIRNLQIVRDEPFVNGPIERVIIQGVDGGGFGATGPTGPTGADGVSGGGLLPPVIIGINGTTGIVYFDNPAGLQVEIYKFIKKARGVHSSRGTVYSDRKGKRYRPLRQLANGSTSWTVEDRWINPISRVGSNTNLRNYFKLGVRDPDTGERSPLTTITIATAVNFEYVAAGIRESIRILLHPHIV
tara:strand:+ start:107178 stop:107744 length:567 start_codon:yes stop_codon:yes gene_type:complete